MKTGKPRPLDEAELAERIARYWRDRGFSVRATIEGYIAKPGDKQRRQAVRSDLVGGLPPNILPGRCDVATPARRRTT